VYICITSIGRRCAATTLDDDVVPPKMTDFEYALRIYAFTVSEKTVLERFASRFHHAEKLNQYPLDIFVPSSLAHKTFEQKMKAEETRYHHIHVGTFPRRDCRQL
jgi:hypothetical protein